MSSIEIIPVNKRILASVVKLCSELPVSFASLSTPAMHAAVCKEAIKATADNSPSLRMLTALMDNEPAGIVAVVTQWDRYWRGFFIKHPILAFQMIKKRLFSRLRAKRTVSSKTETTKYPPCQDRHWSDNEPGIAKVVFIGVAASARNQGVAAKLYEAMFEHLAQAGVRRLDARINSNNASSLRMHEKCSFVLYQETEDNVFATHDLPS